MNTRNNIESSNKMKKNKTLSHGLYAGLIIFTLAGSFNCVTANNQDKNMNTTNKELTEDNETPVILEMNGKEIKATLNNTLTAQEFIKLLPYTVTVSRAADDLCGSVREKLPSNSSEGKKSWKIGEIGWFGGWFTILVDNEERFSSMPGQGVMIIGKIDDEYIDTVKSFTGSVEIKVRLAK